MTPEQEQQGGKYIDLLNDFIDIATRWDVKAIRGSVNDQFRFSIDFDWHVKNATKYQAGFIQALTHIPDDNWKAWEKKTRSILPMLDFYLNWYHDHESEVKDFDPYNPYRLMNDHIKGTKEIILQYFPDPIETSVRKKETPPPEVNENSKQKHRKAKEPTFYTFDSFLMDDGKALLPSIREEYKSKDPIDYAYLIFALDTLNMLLPPLKVLQKKRKISELHRALITEFGKVGTRQNLASTLIKPDPETLKPHTDKLSGLANDLRKKKQVNSKYVIHYH